MRRAARVRVLLALASLAAGAGCASRGTPPGGPPDEKIPEIVAITPDSNATGVRAPAVVLRFDEVVSERSAPTGQGSAGAFGGSPMSGGGLAALLTISPSDGREEVLWRRTALELRPRRGFRPNTVYRVTLLPGLADLRSNRREEPFTFLFSTGDSVPTGRVSGVVFDWPKGAAAVGARVEVFLPQDSTFRWSVRTDSAGRFTVENLAAGTYEVRAWLDANNDRRISFREISDSSRVALSDSASLELYAFIRDTLPPRIESLEPVDSTALRVTFDRGLLPDWDGLGARLQAADSSEIALGGPFVPTARYDSLAKLQRPAGDTAARDTTAGEPTPLAAGDTTTAPPFARPIPVTSWTAPLAAPLAPGSYVLTVRGPVGLNGRALDARREFRLRPPPPPSRDSTARDSTARGGAARDSTARRP